MKTYLFETREEWLEARKAKITGSRAKDINIKPNITKDEVVKELEKYPDIIFKKASKKEDLEKLIPSRAYAILKAKKIAEAEPKKGYYELIAERLWQDVESDFEDYVPNETPMDRGTRLEKHAVKRFEQETGKKVDSRLILWTREENESIAISPDGVILPPDDSESTEAIECKCLSSASHLEAFLTNTIPDEYYMQGLQYMIVNDLVETVYFVFYDPRIPVKDYFVIEMQRADVLGDIIDYLDYQIITVRSVEDVVAKLSGF